MRIARRDRPYRVTATPVGVRLSLDPGDGLLMRAFLRSSLAKLKHHLRDWPFPNRRSGMHWHAALLKALLRHGAGSTHLSAVLNGLYADGQRHYGCFFVDWNSLLENGDLAHVRRKSLRRTLSFVATGPDYHMIVTRRLIPWRTPLGSGIAPPRVFHWVLLHEVAHTLGVGAMKGEKAKTVTVARNREEHACDLWALLQLRTMLSFERDLLAAMRMGRM